MAEQFFNKDDQHRNRLEIDAILCESLGTVTRPAIALGNDQTTGIYRVGNNLVWVINGVAAFTISPTGVLPSIDVTAPVASGVAAVNNSYEGIVTYTGVSVAAAAVGTEVCNNSSVAAASYVTASVIGWTGASPVYVYRVVSGAGTITFGIGNPDPDTASGAGSLTIKFSVQKLS
jgi:hypothetical protein